MTAVPDPTVTTKRATHVGVHRPSAEPSFAAGRTRRAGGLRIGSHLSLAFGCFALAAAVLLPTVAYPRLAVLPADPQQEQLLTASGATVLVPDATASAGARVLSDVNVTISNFVSEAPSGSVGDDVVWQIATQIKVEGRDMINARVEQVSLDRRTAVPANCCGDRIVTSLEDTSGELLTHSGYVAWPFNVQRHSYPIWDINLRRAKTASFVDAETRDGMRTYRFHAVVPLTTVGTTDLPGELFGIAKPSVSAQSQYADVSTYWIEPQTGDVIAIDDQITQQYTYAGRTVTAFAASMHSPRLPADRLDKDRTGSVVLPWMRGWVLFVLVPFGLILLALGVFLGRRRTQNPAR